MEVKEKDKKQIEIREVVRSLSYETLELLFIESKRELDERFISNKIVKSEIDAGDAKRLFKDGYF